MLEAAHRGQRDRAGAVRVGRVDLEDEAVVLGVAVGAGSVLGLLAGQPGVPGGRPARAVDGRTGDGDPLGEHPVVGVEGEGGTAALAGRVVGEALDGGDGDAAAGPVLVVADQVHAAPAGREGRHAVVVGGDRALAGAQRLALPGEHPVAEALRQVEQSVGVGDEGAVTAVAEGLRGGGAGEEFAEGAGERDPRGHRTGPGEDLTAGGGPGGRLGDGPGGGLGDGHGETFLLADRTVTPPCLSLARTPGNHARAPACPLHVPPPGRFRPVPGPGRCRRTGYRAGVSGAVPPDRVPRRARATGPVRPVP
ncbi:hypothetical protein SFUMM280S_09891 [Streptomyces fumanus]